MPTLTVCRVVRTSVRLGPERTAQALKIILTLAVQRGLDHGIGHFRGSRGGLRGAGGNSTDSKIDANIDRGF